MLTPAAGSRDRSERPFWIAFAAILGAAVVCRIVWTRAVLFPANTPDSSTYLLPALLSPAFPLDEARPIAFPYLISRSLALFGHPVGILVAHNVLAVGCAAFVALAVARRLELPAAALLLLVGMLFAAKNVAFEYLLLSEHLSRSVFLAVAGVLLWLRRPSWSAAVLLALLAVVGILTKPTAAVVLPAIVCAYVVRRKLSPSWTPRQVIRASAVSLTLATILVAAYMAVYARRFGSFAITAMNGYSLFWNVHPLLDIDGPAYPEVKRELRTFYPLYLEKYARRGRSLGDWATFGWRTPETDRDFGPESPARVVRAYALRHGSGSLFHRIDRVFLGLALEGIRAHPFRYLGMSIRSAARLPIRGLTFRYPFDAVDDVNGGTDRAEFFRLWAVVARVPSRHLSYASSPPPPIFAALPRVVGRAAETCFPAMSAAAAVLCGVAVKRGLGSRDRERLLRILPLVLCVALTIVLYALVVPSEPDRLMQPVQDLVVLIVLAAFTIGVRSIFDRSSPLKA